MAHNLTGYFADRALVSSKWQYVAFSYLSVCRQCTSLLLQTITHNSVVGLEQLETQYHNS
jgi:hypothetical protein